MESPIINFPESIAASMPDAKLFYRKKSGVIGVIGKLDEIACLPVCKIEPDRIAVYRSDDLQSYFAKSSLQLVAVYSVHNSNDILVPTGKIFIRLEDNASLKVLTEELGQLGFRLIQLAPFVENAGWLASDKSDIAAALQEYTLLTSLSGLVHVEPQLLRQSMSRSL